MLLSLWLATVLLTSILRTWLMSTSHSPRASALDLHYGRGATGGHPGPPGSVASSTVVADNGTPPDLLLPPTCTTTTAGDKSFNYLSPVVGKTASVMVTPATRVPLVRHQPTRQSQFALLRNRILLTVVVGCSCVW